VLPAHSIYIHEYNLRFFPPLSLEHGSDVLIPSLHPLFPTCASLPEQYKKWSAFGWLIGLLAGCIWNTIKLREGLEKEKKLLASAVRHYSPDRRVSYASH